MSTSTPFAPQVPLWDPSQGDLTREHGLYPTQVERLQLKPQELISSGWYQCPTKNISGGFGNQGCGFLLTPENMAQVRNDNGYFTCPRCKLTHNLLEGLPWHGVEEPDYYPKQGTGGGTQIGLPMEDVGQIGENVIQGMGQVPGYGPITWWHGATLDRSPLDGTVKNWGLEVKSVVYDAAGHFWDPGGRPGSPDADEGLKKLQAAQEMGLQGVLAVMVLLNFRSDKADVYVKEIPVNHQWKNPLPKWHKRTGTKVASGISFPSPYKDPNNPSPGPYSLESYYQKPTSPKAQPVEDMPF